MFKQVNFAFSAFFDTMAVGGWLKTAAGVQLPQEKNFKKKYW
jgi:hypothetical protein